ncbi:MAG: hypothetical protein WAX04_10625, partial [Oscillospiraceae bacterium]
IRTYQELIAKTQLISQPIVIPIICVTGEKHTVLSATSELNQFLLNAGYPCKSFYYGDMAIYSYSNIDWIPRSVPIEKLLAFHVALLELSLVLVVNDMTQDIFEIADAHICFSPIAKRNRYDGDNITIPQNYTVENLKCAVKYIEKIGSEE